MKASITSVLVTLLPSVTARAWVDKLSPPIVFTESQGLNITTHSRQYSQDGHPDQKLNHTVTMGVSPSAYNFSSADGSNGTISKRHEVGPSRENPDGVLNEYFMEEAMRCLEEQFCSNRQLRMSSYISCTVGDMMAYVCNHVGGPGGGVTFMEYMTLGLSTLIGNNPCSLSEMKEKWEDLKQEKDVALGWWYEDSWRKLYGWDISGAEVCGNIIGGRWMFRMNCEGCECKLWENFY